MAKQPKGLADTGQQVIATAFKRRDLVQLRSERDCNPSLFRIRRATAKTLILGQLSETANRYIGVDIRIDLTDPADVAELVTPSPEILAMYAIHVR